MAAAEAEEALAIDPTDVRAMQLRFDAYRLAGNDVKAEEAAQALEKVLEVEPDHARAHYLLGVALFNTGQTGPASEHLRRFIELAPDDPDAVIAKDLLAYAE